MNQSVPRVSVAKYRVPVPPGVVYLRLVPKTPIEAGEVVLALLAQEELELTQRYTVIDVSIHDPPLDQMIAKVFEQGNV